MDAHLLWLLPLFPLLTALGLLCVRSRRWLATIDVAGSLCVSVLAVRLARAVAVNGPLQGGGVFGADALASIFVLLIGFLFPAVSIYSIGWIPAEVERGGMKEQRLRYYYALVHGFVATMLATVLADNLGILWIAMEGTTITSALLVGFHGHRHGLEAAWKYIIVTTIGISFGLFGTVVIYAAAAQAQGGGGTMSYTSIIAVADRLDPGIVRIGFIFVLIGYGTKCGLAPMHMWLPDAHSQAPTPVSALLSGALIKCALFGIIRFHTIARRACGPDLSGGLLIFFGIASIVIAAPFILTQRDLKRLLGYSSVEHVGVIALGLGFGGRVGTYGALFHVVSHGVTKALVFFVAGDAIGRCGSRNMRSIKGLLAAAPWAGTLMLMGAFSLAGAPPFSVFVSELMVLRAGISGGHVVAVVLFISMTVLIFAGLIHHVGQMVFGAKTDRVQSTREPAAPLAAMLAMAIAMLLLGVFIPANLDRVIERATEIILG